MTSSSLKYKTFKASLVLALAFFSCSAMSADIEIKLAHPNVPQHPMGKGFIKFKKMVESKSNNNIHVKIYDSSKFGDAGTVVQSLQTGVLQMASASAPNLTQFSKKFELFGLPYLFPNYKIAHEICDGPIGKELSHSLRGTGIKGLGYIDIGFRHIFNSKHVVKTPQDAQGLKIRSTASPLQIAKLKALGMNPTPVAWSEVYTALQQGTVDGIDIDLNLAWYNNFPEVMKYVTLDHSSYSPHLVMINRRFFNNLKPKYQKIIKTSFEKMKTFERSLIVENEDKIIKKMKNEGIIVTKLNKKQLNQWKKATEGIDKKFESDIGKNLINRTKEAVKKAEAGS